VHDTSPGALEGLRVLDATQMLAGPLAATRLGDLGADVIKIEPPKDGEFNRTHGFGDARHADLMTTFLAVNRNKRSLAVDLKSDEGREAVRRLAASSDIFIQNFRHGTAERLGIGYDDLAPLNPGIVYCSISGFGPAGPYRDRPGQDLILQGYSGSMYSVGADGDAPSPGALWAADVMTGYQAVIGILAAVQERSRSGLGQHIEIDMFSVVLDSQLQELVTYLNTGEAPTRSGSPTAHASIPAPYGVYRTADGWLTLAMSPLVALGELLDSDWLRSLTDYNDGMIRRDEIYAHIELSFLGRTTAEWIELADRHGVWAGPVHDYASLAEDPHLQATGAFVHQPQGDVPTLTLRPPLSLSRTPAEIRRGAPRLGEHTAEVLRSIGYDAEQIARLRDAGVVREMGDEGGQR
jgi:crotonobetainyl-CoA:carnitine CoA-transferase CaiB-like acyl-CoA transferase